jgi:2-oxoglutarate ferredoxin oxidoreductase subunit alpha
MLKLLPPEGGICLQCEDEIASMGSCLGASMAGLKVLTATAGPGLSLYSEHISFAIGSEIPVVIVDVQRLGPSTGSATRGADGDIQFMRWGNSGGLPVIVLAPVDVKDCYLLTVHAFNLAETYRCPVFIASNKEIGMTREGVDLDSLSLPEIVDRKAPARGEPFLPFAASAERPVPAFLPIGHETLVRQTSSTHGANGYITTDPAEIGETTIRLKKKLTSAVERFSFHESRHADNADTLIISYGVTSRAVKDAQSVMNQKGKPVSTLVLKTLWPVPESLIQDQAKDIRRILVVEMNLGQYVREIRRLLPGATVDFLGRMDGQLITPLQIEEAVENA